jgi:hypothetical protein
MATLEFTTAQPAPYRMFGHSQQSGCFRNGNLQFLPPKL